MTAILDTPKSFNVVKERCYGIMRDGKPYDVYMRPSGDYVVKRRVGGGATSATPQSQAQQAQGTLKNYLKVAPTKYYTILGTIAAGATGGSTANVVWQQPIPIIPAFCTAIDLIVTLPLTVTITAGAFLFSEFWPYSAFSTQMTLGGAPPWPYTETLPWHIDSTMHRVDYDPSYTGLGGQGVASNANPALAGNILDYGPAATKTAFGNTPLQSVAATASATTTFVIRIQLQRKRHLLWGAIPFGDPENRPNFLMQLNPLVGTLLEQSAGINNATGNAVGTVQAGQTCNVYAVYHLSYIDLLPPSVSQPPTPAVGYGIQLTPSSPSGQVAGQLYPMTHRTAQVYTSIHHILVNNPITNVGAAIEADYFGLWDDQDPQSARWSYDAQSNTFQEYFNLYHRNYRRYPYMGVYSAEFDDGIYPEIPSVTPYTAYMTPDAAYAQAFDLPVTPAMTTSMRIPTGTTITAPTYIRQYEFGLVRVPY